MADSEAGWHPRQRCWIHTMRNILDKLPRANQPQARQALQTLYRATDRQTAHILALELAGTWQKSYRQAAECVLSDLDECLTYFDFPPLHWKHLKTSNPIESIFAPVRLRTHAIKGDRSQSSAAHLIFHVVEGWLLSCVEVLSTHWRCFDGAHLLSGLLDQAQEREANTMSEPMAA